MTNEVKSYEEVYYYVYLNDIWYFAVLLKELPTRNILFLYTKNDFEATSTKKNFKVYFNSLLYVVRILGLQELNEIYIMRTMGRTGRTKYARFF